MRAVNLWVAAALVVVGLGGCATPVNVMGVKTLNDVGTPATGSKFSKVTKGMSQANVFDLIGAAKDCAGKQEQIDNTIYLTTECPYKNEGTLIFDVHSKLNSIRVNTGATDYQPISK